MEEKQCPFQVGRSCREDKCALWVNGACAFVQIAINLQEGISVRNI